ncbi:MAG: ATP phosphoribosyltransferase regulatory subunit, partial [Kiritimatiellae bacterium]|nr:ATP phosphoribosyltransferase regulatory subunit [Kiritimatiellia bacterium]
LDLLKRKSGEEIVAQIYAFKDKSNRDLALRPEITPTLARMIAARQGQLAFPLKWFAVAQCFRYERMSRGRKREHYQWNLDVVGEACVSAEVEVLACAVHALSLLGLNAGEVKVHLSSRALLADLLAKAGIPTAFHAATFLALDKRGKLEDADIRRLLQESGLNVAAIEAVFRIVGIKSLDQAAAMLGEQTPSLAAVQTLFRLANEYDLGAMLLFDIGVVRGLGYYTGMVFEAFDAERKFRALFGGGRYDNLLGDVGGVPMTAVGLGFGDVVIAELLADKGRLAGQQAKLNCAVGYMEDLQQAIAMRLAQAMRRAGQSVDVALHAEKPKQFFGRVGKGGFQKAVYVGPDDVARDTVRIKNLDDRTEEEKSLSDLIGMSQP